MTWKELGPLAEGFRSETRQVNLRRDCESLLFSLVPDPGVQIRRKGVVVEWILRKNVDPFNGRESMSVDD